MHRFGYRIPDHSVRGCSREKGKLFQNGQGESWSPVFHVIAQVVAQNSWLWCMYFVSLVRESTLCSLLILSSVFWKLVGVHQSVEIWLNWYFFFPQQWKAEKLRKRMVLWKNCLVLQRSSFPGNLWTQWNQNARANFLQWVRFPHESPTWRDGWGEGPMFILAAFCSSYEVFYIVFTTIHFAAILSSMLLKYLLID